MLQEILLGSKKPITNFTLRKEVAPLRVKHKEQSIWRKPIQRRQIRKETLAPRLRNCEPRRYKVFSVGIDKV